MDCKSRVPLAEVERPDDDDWGDGDTFSKLFRDDDLGPGTALVEED